MKLMNFYQSIEEDEQKFIYLFILDFLLLKKRKKEKLIKEYFAINKYIYIYIAIKHLLKFNNVRIKKKQQQ